MIFTIWRYLFILSFASKISNYVNICRFVHIVPLMCIWIRNFMRYHSTLHLIERTENYIYYALLIYDVSASVQEGLVNFRRSEGERNSRPGWWTVMIANSTDGQKVNRRIAVTTIIMSHSSRWWKIYGPSDYIRCLQFYVHAWYIG